MLRTVEEPFQDDTGFTLVGSSFTGNHVFGIYEHARKWSERKSELSEAAAGRGTSERAAPEEAIPKTVRSLP
jgi:hypothetical protein